MTGSKHKRLQMLKLIQPSEKRTLGMKVSCELVISLVLC
jgi:hypothetical protein